MAETVPTTREYPTSFTVSDSENHRLTNPFCSFLSNHPFLPFVPRVIPFHNALNPTSTLPCIFDSDLVSHPDLRYTRSSYSRRLVPTLLSSHRTIIATGFTDTYSLFKHRLFFPISQHLQSVDIESELRTFGRKRPGSTSDYIRLKEQHTTIYTRESPSPRLGQRPAPSSV